MPSQESHVYKIPLRLVKKRFGSESETDRAADEFHDCLVEVLDGQTFPAVSYSHNTSHDNPWYHSIDCRVAGISPQQVEALETLLVRRELLAAGSK